MTKQPESKYLPPKQIHKKLGVTKRRLHLAIQDGLIKDIKWNKLHTHGKYSVDEVKAVFDLI